jgi:hypothetical protein
MKDFDMGLTPHIVSAGKLAMQFTKEGQKAHKEAWTKFRREVRERSSRDLTEIDHKLTAWVVSGRMALEIYRNLALRQYYNLARSWKTVIGSGLLGDFDPLTEKLSKETARKVVAMLKPMADERKLESQVYAAFKTLSDFSLGTGDFGRRVRRDYEDELDQALAQLGTAPQTNVEAAPDRDEDVEEEFAMETDRVAELTARIAELTAQKDQAAKAEDYTTAAAFKTEIEAAKAELSALQAEDTVVLPDGKAQKEAKRSELTAQIAELLIQKAAAVQDEKYDVAGQLKAQIDALQTELSAMENPTDTTPVASPEPSPAAPAAEPQGAGSPPAIPSRTVRAHQGRTEREKGKQQANGGDGHPVTDPVERLAAHGVTEETDPKVIALVRTAGETKSVRNAFHLLPADPTSAINKLRGLAAQLEA